MKVLVIGGGGREHAIAWKLSRSKHITGIYSSPGSAGIAEIARCIDLSPNDFDAILDFVKYEWIGLTIVCDEKFLADGVVNLFEREGRRILGPDRRVAQMVSSRAETKNLMRRHGVPTPEYKVFTSYLHALDYIRLKGTPIVIKTDGQAGGANGTFVAASAEDATGILKMVMEERMFGDAGRRVIVEEVVKGERLSVVAMTDGRVIRPLTNLHIERSEEGFPKGGAFGAYSPAHDDSEVMHLLGKITAPLLKAFHSEGINYKGFVSMDLVVNKDRVHVFDLNCCVGDLESQTVLPRLKTDFVEVAMAIVEERLFEAEIEMEQNAAVCIAGASESNAKSGNELIISGLDKMKTMPEVVVFHENPSFGNSDMVPRRERVFSLTATGKDLNAAREKAYRAIGELDFAGMRYSKDIGKDIGTGMLGATK